MARVIATTTIEATDGALYEVRICGRRVGRRWEGWIEFVPATGSPVLRTPRETTQPTLAILQHWASTLTPVYLDGALTRAKHSRVPHVVTVEPEAPFYDAPAPDPHTTAAVIVAGPASSGAICDGGFTDVEGAVLDPFSVYAKGGDEGLRKKLDILGAEHLRRIARGYRLVSDDWDLSAFSKAEVADLIVVGVRGRCAAEADKASPEETGA
jgi:hypothetical protein